MTFTFTILTIACISRLLSGWNVRVYILLLFTSLLLGLCKQTYVLIPFLCLLFWKNIPGSLIARIKHIILVLACACLPMIIWSLSTRSIYSTYLKGIQIDPVLQMNFFFENITTLTYYFFENIFYTNFEGYFHSMYGILGWLDTPLPHQNTYIHFSLYIASFLFTFRKNAHHDQAYKAILIIPHISLSSRLTSLLILLFTVFLIALCMFLTWNQVGVFALQGIQGRYFIPLLPLPFFIFYKLIYINFKKQSVYLLWIISCLIIWAYLSSIAIKSLLIRYWIL